LKPRRANAFGSSLKRTEGSTNQDSVFGLEYVEEDGLFDDLIKRGKEDG
jgi:hypothetical protein